MVSEEKLFGQPDRTTWTADQLRAELYRTVLEVQQAVESLQSLRKIAVTRWRNSTSKQEEIYVRADLVAHVIDTHLAEVLNWQ